VGGRERAAMADTAGVRRTLFFPCQAGNYDGERPVDKGGQGGGRGSSGEKYLLQSITGQKNSLG